MRMQFAAMICSALVGFAALSSPALSEQKTVKACQDEWRANKDAYQAGAVTEKAYVDKCRAGETIALPAAPPAPATSTPAGTPASAPSAKPAATRPSAPAAKPAAPPGA